ncbi:MAG: polyphosphate polymerase domain-containing protein [Porcipelethomonas sp.]
MNEVTRQEKKYMLSYDQFRTLDRKISAVLHPDKHSGTDGYSVRSLYFDRFGDGDYYDKTDGIETRRKIRLRVYPPEFGCAVLEMKQKQGNNQKKRSLAITPVEADELCRGRYQCLIKRSQPFAGECYGLMNTGLYRPKTIIEYERKAYCVQENKTRLTFDFNIRASEASTHLMDPELNLYPVLDYYQVILEVKYNGFLLGYVKELLDDCGNIPVSASKYCLGRNVSL